MLSGKSAFYFILINLILFANTVSTLNCFICGDSNLDEFGECSTQFQYDCTNYAKRFSKDEEIFCRTTRQKAINNTFTIMKECISESDHFKTFPKKTSKFDEECDLVDINGLEIAYCLCKSNDFCNQKPISEQFIKFEEEHPELFDNDDTISTSKVSPNGMSIKTINENNDLKRHPSNDNLEKNTGVDKDVLSTNIMKTSFPITDISSNKPIIPENINGKKFGNGLNNIKKIVPSIGELYCYQCAQGKLENEDSDCTETKIVDCTSLPTASLSGKNYCFTRQIILGKQKNAVEKMCVSHEALIQEYGNDVKIDKCEISENKKIRYCVCKENECNKNSISSQISKEINEINSKSNTFEVESSNVEPIKAIVKHHFSCNICSQSDLTHATGDCSNQLSIECPTNNGKKNFCLTRQTQLSSGLFNIEKRCISETEFRENFPDEQLHNSELQVGCASVFDGFVNYCICDTNNCNKDALIRQVQKINNLSESSIDNNKSILSTNNEKKNSQLTTSQITNSETPQIDSINSHSILVPVKGNSLDKPILTSKATSVKGFNDVENKEIKLSNLNRVSNDNDDENTTKSIFDLNRDRLEKWKDSEILSTAISGKKLSSFSYTNVLIFLIFFYILSVLLNNEL
uniref:UPAR/Ly6 domain-containing protein n=1 Tax=Strongyloides stercoralis TaxID=6248 RepID=A0A0K0ESS2_STRER